MLLMLLELHHLFKLFTLLCDSFPIYSMTDCISVWRGRLYSGLRDAWWEGLEGSIV